MTSASAQTATRVPGTEIKFQLLVPNATADAAGGVGDIYFQIAAPTTYSWVGLGQGHQMSGSNMFVVYTSADGQNVTLSPRLGTGHSMPEYNQAANVSLLAGSGVSNGVMTANVRCGSCSSWQGGSMDLTSAGSTKWIYAHDRGDKRILRVSPMTGASEQVGAFPIGKIGDDCDVTPDGRSIVCALVESKSDAWVIHNFDPKIPPASRPTG